MNVGTSGTTVLRFRIVFESAASEFGPTVSENGANILGPEEFVPLLEACYYVILSTVVLVVREQAPTPPLCPCSLYDY